MHAANLIRAIKSYDENSVFTGFGGDMMQNAGCRIVRHYRDMAYMGVVDVVLHARKALSNLRFAKQTLLETRPQVLILVDYPSFNMQIASFCRSHLPQTRIVWYIPPKVWAWKSWRIHKLQGLADMVLGIFPFEPEFYRKYGYKAKYVGNPTVGMIKEYKAVHNSLQRKNNLIALLPGSRKHEVSKSLPRMLAAASAFKGYETEVAMAPALSREFYEKLIADTKKRYCLHDIQLRLTDDTYSLLSVAAVAVVNSGTATLETAMSGCPQVAVYHLNFGHLLNVLRPLMFKTPFFTLPNIIAGKQIIKELLAYEFTIESVRKELEHLLCDNDYRKQMLNDYNRVADILGSQNAADTAALLILSDFEQTEPA